MRRPYKFLDAYGYEDADLFFGRERETRVLISDILSNRLVVLFARTGTGKTSLLNAGVRPKLERQGYQTFYVRVTHDPLDRLHAALCTHERLTDLPAGSLQQLLTLAADRLGQPIIVFFDQFEEFFLYMQQHPKDAQHFVGDVAALYDDRDRGVHLVFSMREDFIPEMDIFRGEIPTIFHNDSTIRLRHFTADQAREAIVRPARLSGVYFDREVTERIVADLAGAPTFDGSRLIEPAHLQIVCDTMWRNHREGDPHITISDYLRLGDARPGANVAPQILFRRLEDDLADVESERELDLLARLLPELCTPESTKRVRCVTELASALGVSEEALSGTLSKLSRERIVVLSQWKGAPMVELTHDYLVEGLDEFADRVRLIYPRRQLRAAVARSQATGATMSARDLELIAPYIERLDPDAAGLALFLRSGLKEGHGLHFWVRPKPGHEFVWQVLRDAISGSDPSADAYPSHAIELLHQILRQNDDEDTEKIAIGLVRLALERDDMYVEAQSVLAKLMRSSRARLAATARSIVVDFVDRALVERRALAPAAVGGLGHLEESRPHPDDLLRVVSLLERALDREDVRLDAQRALTCLSFSADEESAESARVVLREFVARTDRKHVDQLVPETLLVFARWPTQETIVLLERVMLENSGKVGLTARRLLKRFLDRPSENNSHAEVTRALSSSHPPTPSVIDATHARRARGTLGVSELHALARYIDQGQCILFLGPDVHAPPAFPDDSLGRDYQPRAGRYLTQRLAEASGFHGLLPESEASTLARVAQHAELRLGRQNMIRVLRDALVGVQPSPLLRLFAQMPFSFVITTNLDSCFEDALRAADRSPRVVGLSDLYTLLPSEPWSYARPLVIKVCGDLRDRPVITENDWIELIVETARPDAPDHVAMLTRMSVLVAGLNLGQLEHRLLFRLLPRQDFGRLQYVYVVDPDPDPRVVHTWERDGLVEFLRDDLWNVVPELSRLIGGSAQPVT